MTEPWKLVLRDENHGTHALTNGRAQLSVWTGEVEDPDLEALRRQLAAGQFAEKLEQVAALVCWDCRKVSFTQDLWGKAGCPGCGEPGYLIPVIFREVATPPETENGYPISRDYDRLWDLAGSQDVVCFVDYARGDDPPLRDIAVARRRDPEWADIGARGISYVSAANRKRFRGSCERAGVAFIDPVSRHPEPSEGGETVGYRLECCDDAGLEVVAGIDGSEECQYCGATVENGRLRVTPLTARPEPTEALREATSVLRSLATGRAHDDREHLCWCPITRNRGAAGHTPWCLDARRWFSDHADSARKEGA